MKVYTINDMVIKTEGNVHFYFDSDGNINFDLPLIQGDKVVHLPLTFKEAAIIFHPIQGFYELKSLEK